MKLFFGFSFLQPKKKQIGSKFGFGRTLILTALSPQPTLEELLENYLHFRFLVTNKAGRLGIYDQLSHCNFPDTNIKLNTMESILVTEESNDSERTRNISWARRIGRECFKEKDILFNFYVDPWRSGSFKEWITISRPPYKLYDFVSYKLYVIT